MRKTVNVLTYVIAYVAGIVLIVIGADADNNGKAYIAFGIYVILLATWAGLWTERGKFAPDFQNQSLIEKFGRVGEVVTIPAIIGLVIVLIVAFV